MMHDACVLVVDDDDDIREMLGVVLNLYGYSVSLAADGQEALERLREDAPIALILLDLMMPNLNGIELMSAMRESGVADAIPVVVISGNSAAREAAETMGAAGFLAKPVEVPDLIAAVQRYARPPAPPVLPSPKSGAPRTAPPPLR